jgi:GNAT superfamily N-acetyltransferase
MTREWTRGGFTISTDPRRLDVDVVHGFLVRSYWAEGVPRDVVERSITNSLVFGLYEGTAQVGFARAVTDRATFAQLMDVFVLERWRGRGLGVWLVEVVMAHPELQGLRLWSLGTKDAHELYRRFGFRESTVPERRMEKLDPDVYRRR